LSNRVFFESAIHYVQISTMSAVRFFFFGLRHLGGLHALQVMMTRRLRSRRGSWGAWSKDNSTFDCIFCGASIPHVLWSSTTLMVDLVWSDVSSAGAHGMSSRNSVSVDDETLIHSHSVSSEIDYIHYHAILLILALQRHQGKTRKYRWSLRSQYLHLP
jgi:hypothetical protein